jgi:hypothetical protein
MTKINEILDILHHDGANDVHSEKIHYSIGTFARKWTLTESAMSHHNITNEGFKAK